MSGKGSKMKCLFCLLPFLLGLGIVLYPQLRGAAVGHQMRYEAEEFLSRVETVPFCREEPVVPPEDGVEPVPTVPEQYPELWEQMRAYNTRIFDQGQSGLDRPEAYEAPSFRLRDYGLESEVFGVLTVPALELEMPLYLGASGEHMAAGAAVLSQTSVPVGGLGTNAVIAGHRGWNGGAYLLHIDKLKPGDTVTVTNLWESLSYTVTEIQIISPNDIEAIRIRPDKDMITLLSCHPPASGGKQQYLVFCERTT